MELQRGAGGRNRGWMADIGQGGRGCDTETARSRAGNTQGPIRWRRAHSGGTPVLY